MGDGLETAAEYLQFHNFKSMVEWMTAEVILSRPDDPFQFLGGLLRSKVKSRGGADYDPAGTTDLVRQCYALAAEEADEHGRIRGGGAKGFADEDDDDEFGDIDFGGSGASGEDERLERWRCRGMWCGAWRASSVCSRQPGRKLARGWCCHGRHHGGSDTFGRLRARRDIFNRCECKNAHSF